MTQAVHLLASQASFNVFTIFKGFLVISLWPSPAFCSPGGRKKMCFSNSPSTCSETKANCEGANQNLGGWEEICKFVSVWKVRAPILKWEADSTTHTFKWNLNFVCYKEGLNYTVLDPRSSWTSYSPHSTGSSDFPVLKGTCIPVLRRVRQKDFQALKQTGLHRETLSKIGKKRKDRKNKERDEKGRGVGRREIRRKEKPGLGSDGKKFQKQFLWFLYSGMSDLFVPRTY